MIDSIRKLYSPSAFGQHQSIDKMQEYWGLRGSRLIWAVLIVIVGPAYTCFGYNQGVAGNVLTLESFVNVFPQIDTVNTTGPREQHNSTIQGTI